MTTPEFDLDYVEDEDYTLENERKRQINQKLERIEDNGQSRSELIQTFNQKIDHAKNLLISSERRRKVLRENNKDENVDQIKLDFQKSMLYLGFTSVLIFYSLYAALPSLGIISGSAMAAVIVHSMDLSRRLRDVKSN